MIENKKIRNFFRFSVPASESANYSSQYWQELRGHFFKKTKNNVPPSNACYPLKTLSWLNLELFWVRQVSNKKKCPPSNACNPLQTLSWLNLVLF